MGNSEFLNYAKLTIHSLLTIHHSLHCFFNLRVKTGNPGNAFYSF